MKASSTSPSAVPPAPACNQGDATSYQTRWCSPQIDKGLHTLKLVPSTGNLIATLDAILLIEDGSQTSLILPTLDIFILTNTPPPGTPTNTLPASTPRSAPTSTALGGAALTPASPPRAAPRSYNGIFSYAVWNDLRSVIQIPDNALETHNKMLYDTYIMENKLLRTQILLEPEQQRELALIAENNKTSISKIVREMIAEGIKTRKREQLVRAAKLAIVDYSTDADLIAFTDLDGEDFHA